MANDDIDQRLGEPITPDGLPPERGEIAESPSFRSLTTARLWSEIENGNGEALVGMKLPGMSRGYYRGKVFLSPDEALAVREGVLAVTGVQEVNGHVGDRSWPLMDDGRQYPAICITLESQDTLTTLRTLDFVDYIEPLNLYSGVGCAMPDYGGNSLDEMFSTPGSADGSVSWNFRHHRIQDAWGLFRSADGTIRSPGRNITISVVDTGVYPDTPRLNEYFALPAGSRPPPRHLTATRDATIRCNHGTRIAGLATAPYDAGRYPDNEYLGVAWGAQLVTVKVADGVAQTGLRLTDVVEGLYASIGAGRHVVTLAFGVALSSDYLRDNISRIYYSKPDVIFIGAAGTNIPYVAFPASMSEVIAVTIVDFVAQPRPVYKLYTLDRTLDIVAYGEKVSFAAVNGAGDIPTTGNSAKPLTTIGGSSAATAIVAGIAALAWSRQPDLTRADLIQRLAVSSSFARVETERSVVGGRSPRVGFGLPNAYVAAGGFTRVGIEGPESVRPGERYTLQASTDGVSGSAEFRWDTGETGGTLSAVAPSTGNRTHVVTARNAIDGTEMRASHVIVTQPVRLRRIYSAELVSEWATFFNGKRVDRLINIGRQLPRGCSIFDVRALEYREIGGIVQPYGLPVASKDNGNSGYTVFRPGGVTARSLDAVAHVWHDGYSSIRLRVVYDVLEPFGVDSLQGGGTIAVP